MLLTRHITYYVPGSSWFLGVGRRMWDVGSLCIKL